MDGQWESSPQNNLLQTPTVYEALEENPIFKNYFTYKGGEARVTVFQHYARGTDEWITLDWWNIWKFIPSVAYGLDKIPGDHAEKWLNENLLDGIWPFKARNDIPFPGLFVLYFAGLDHEAHDAGMSGYTKFLRETTDDEIEDIANWLKKYGEFDNKIFIITADHGHTAMADPSQMIFSQVKRDENGNIIGQKIWEGDASCKLNVKGFNKADNLYPELANNNLHIWELGNLFTQFPSPVQGIELKVLAPVEIANEVSGATADINETNIISALNGPMAHIYIKGANWQDNPDLNILEPLVSLLYTVFKDGSNATGTLRTTINDHFPNLSTSIDKILVRRELNGLYEVVTGVSEDASGNAVIDTDSLDSLSDTDYINAVERITQMNHSKRSGDIVLIMKDDMSDINQHFSTGVSCKSWHGGLNKSDSYVPFVMAYPGGSKYELNNVLNVVCAKIECNGNWILSELIKEIVETQYSGQ